MISDEIHVSKPCELRYSENVNMHFIHLLACPYILAITTVISHYKTVAIYSEFYTLSQLVWLH